MIRLTLFACGLVVLVGCGKGSDNKGGSSSTDGGGTRPPLTKESTPKDVVNDYLSSAYGNVEIVSCSNPQQARLQNAAATAVHVVWRVKGEAEQKSELFIIQDQKVKRAVNFDAAKSFEQNVAEAVQ